MQSRLSVPYHPCAEFFSFFVRPVGSGGRLSVFIDDVFYKAVVVKSAVSVDVPVERRGGGLVADRVVEFRFEGNGVANNENGFELSYLFVN